MYRIKSLFKFFVYFIRGNKIICTDYSVIKLFNTKIKNSIIRVSNKSKLIIGENTVLENVNFNINDGSTIIIGNNCNIKDLIIDSKESHFILGNDNIFQKGDMYGHIPILLRNSKLNIGNHNRFRCKKIWVRFNANLTIGNYNNFNEYSELRCDELIRIGNFNQISYSVKIWDTNTHCIYNFKTRREMTINSFPDFGKEYEKPKTNPVYVGSDNWIGMNVIILKGTTIGDRNNLGIGTILSKEQIQSDKTVVNNTTIRILNNQR